KFAFMAKGKSQQTVLLLDSTGRSYGVPAHSLPSARGQGEPVTSRLNPPSGASFVGVLMGEDAHPVLLATDAGYGFIATLGDMQSKTRSGKVLLKVPEGARVLPPALIQDVEKPQLVAVTNDGRMLVFPVTELPVLAKGKGNKIIGIQPGRLETREEYMVAVAPVMEDQTVKVWAGKRFLQLRLKDMKHYVGERGRRGHKLPHGFQRVESLEIVG